MSAIKRMYEENFDEVVTYQDLRENGLTPGEIYIQWKSFSKLSWEEFIARKSSPLMK